MNPPNAADSAVGLRLLQARESAGHSLAEMSAQTHMPSRVLSALEQGDWSELGAPVYVRGQLRAYARALGVSLNEAVLPAGRVTRSAPALVCHVHVPRYQHMAESLGRRLVYIVMTIALVVPVWLATRTHQDGLTTAPLDVPGNSSTSVQADGGRTALVASFAPLPAESAPVPAPLQVEFAGESWMQLYAADGSLATRTLLHAGEHRDLGVSDARTVVLGNAKAVRVLREGQPVDLARYTQANVARFTLSSDGSLAPVAP